MAASLPEVAQTASRRKLPDASVVSPESVGFSSERLENLHKLMQDEIDQKQLAGAITWLARAMARLWIPGSMASATSIRIHDDQGHHLS